MDLMKIRRGLMAQMAKGLNLPSNVEVKTFTLDADLTGSSNFTIPNPFGRTDMNRIIGINFADNPANIRSVAFLVNPANGLADNEYNRKIINIDNHVAQCGYYAIVSITNESIVLRNNGIYNFAAGTYYMFAW